MLADSGAEPAVIDEMGFWNCGQWIETISYCGPNTIPMPSAPPCDCRDLTPVNDTCKAPETESMANGRVRFHAARGRLVDR